MCSGEGRERIGEGVVRKHEKDRINEMINNIVDL